MCFISFICNRERINIGFTGKKTGHIDITPSVTGKRILGRTLTRGWAGDVWFTYNNPMRAAIKNKSLGAVLTDQVEEIEISYDCAERYSRKKKKGGRLFIRTKVMSG